MAAIPSSASKARLSFARVAASSSIPQPSSSDPLTFQDIQHNPDGGEPQKAAVCDDMNRQSSDTLQITESGDISPSVVVESGDAQIDGQSSKLAALSGATIARDYHREPVSEANITKITSSQTTTEPFSADGRSVISATTFTLDEKESLRPDDSASVKATDDEDGRTSTHASSRIGSDSGARAFSDQLREISSMGPSASSQQALPIVGMNSAAPPAGGVLFSPPPVQGSSSFPEVVTRAPIGGSAVPFSPDEKLLEALNSVRDRVWVLKLEQDITDFVKDASAQSFDVPQCNSFYRMLAHKMADYYLLGHTLDSSFSSVKLWKTPNCRIPPRLSTLTNPSTASSTPPPSAPQMQILRREGIGLGRGGRGSGQTSRGENDGDSGSDEGKPKVPSTREEREARYEAARLRIMGSAKPSEDMSVTEKKDDSRSSSTTGKKKARKQRSDSEDGFEARSAYSTFTNSGTTNAGTSANGQLYTQFQNTGGVPYDQSGQSYGVAQPYGNEYQASIPPQAEPYAWYQQGYPAMAEQGSAGWNNQNIAPYDMSSHFQQMSLQQPNMHVQYQQPAHPYGSGSSVHSSPRQWPSQVQPSPHAPAMYQNMSPYQPAGPSPSQSYAYGVLPNQSYVNGKRQNPNHPIPGSFNRQQFNPQSQTFTPGQPSPPPMQSPGFMPYQSTPHPLQRQHSSQSQGSSYGSSYPTTLMGNLPSAQGLTHPLPQPVFSQSSQHSNRQPYQQYGPPSRGSSAGPQSGISKYGGASLPAKPPPPMDGTLSIGMNQPSQGLGHNGPAMHILPSMNNFRSGSGNDGNRHVGLISGGNARPHVQGGSMG